MPEHEKPVFAHERIRAKQQRMLMRNVGISVIPAFLLALLLLWTLSNGSNQPALSAWCAAVILSKLVCYFHARRHLALDISYQRISRLDWELVILNAVDGALWGSLAWVTLDTAGVAGSILVVAVAAGIAGSSMSLLSPRLPVFVVFALAELAALTSKIMPLGDPAYEALGVAGILYAATLLGQARNSSIAVRAAIELRFELDDSHQRLRESEHFLQEAQLMAGLGSYVLDFPSGRWQGTDATYRMFGIDGGHEPSFDEWLELIHPDDRAAVAGHVDRLLATRNCSFDKEYRIVRRDDQEVRWLHGLGRISFDGEGRPLKMLATVQDITEHHRREAELTASHEQLRLKTEIAEAAKREAEQANLDKSKFLAAASHDLRQPTHALGLFIGTLDTMAARPSVPGSDLTRLASRMRTALAGLGNLLGELLDISRLDAGAVQIERRAVALSQAFATLGESFSAPAAEKGVELRVVPCSAWVDADPVLFQRILANLVANAVRYTERGRILVGCRRRAGAIEVQVWDSGIGIAADELERIFAEFYQIGNPARDRAQGLGLGLSIVRRCADFLGTRIDVASTPGKGSRFSFQLPRAAPAAPAAHKARRTLRKLTVLTIDDEREVLDAVQSLLSAWGHEVVPASSVAEAKAAAARLPGIDLIVADYRLGDGTTGVEAIQAALEQLGREVPAVLVTGDTAPERIRAVTASGFAVLHKPLDPERFSEVLDACA